MLEDGTSGDLADVLPGQPKRATSPSMAEVSISRFVAFAYCLFERAKGMRLPPRMTAR
jgi:hypothetical protein